MSSRWISSNRNREFSSDLLEVQRYLSGIVIELHDLDMIWPNFLELLSNPEAHSELTERIIP
jgi:hypothetical protein